MFLSPPYRDIISPSKAFDKIIPWHYLNDLKNKTS